MLGMNVRIMGKVATDINDDSLMLIYREGDADAFDVLFDRHYRAVYNFAWTLLHDAHQAMDVLQEVFLVVTRKTADYQAQGHFKTWLLRICRNRCLNIIETNTLRRKIAEESGFEIMRPRPFSFAADETAERDEKLALARAEMEKLPERQREAIALFAFENMKYREIAAVMELPENTVKTLIYRARKTLAAALREEE